MQKIAILYDAGQAVLSKVDLDGVLQQILTIARDYFHVQDAAILLRDERTNELYIGCHIGQHKERDQIRLPLGAGITGAAAKEKRPIYVPDVSKDSRYVGSIASTRCELAIPLMSRDEVLAVLDLQTANPDH